MEIGDTEKVLREKFDRLKSIILDAGSAAKAFSGGADNTFLFKVCVDVLADKVIAVTARSATFPARELKEAIHLAGYRSGSMNDALIN